MAGKTPDLSGRRIASRIEPEALSVDSLEASASFVR
jgi:hypothetical protein